MTRMDSEESILQRDRSAKDICRSEKHYLNVAYDENCDVSDDEGQQFMFQVDLGKPRGKKSATVSYHIKQRLSMCYKPSARAVLRISALSWQYGSSAARSVQKKDGGLIFSQHDPE